MSACLSNAQPASGSAQCAKPSALLGLRRRQLPTARWARVVLYRIGRECGRASSPSATLGDDADQCRFPLRRQPVSLERERLPPRRRLGLSMMTSSGPIASSVAGSHPGDDGAASAPRLDWLRRPMMLSRPSEAGCRSSACSERQARWVLRRVRHRVLRRVRHRVHHRVRRRLRPAGSRQGSAAGSRRGSGGVGRRLLRRRHSG